MRQLLSVLAIVAMTSVYGCASPVAVEAPADLSPEVLRNLAYTGIDDEGTSLQMENGRWEGAPAVPGAATFPVLTMAEAVTAKGDLDGDGAAEAVVLLESQPGGSGTFAYLAVVNGRTGVARNVATQLIGDRVQVRAIRVEDARIVVDLRGHGPEDPACCPSVSMRRVWKMQGTVLEEVPSGLAAKRVSVAELSGSEWELARWSADEPAPAAPRVTLSYGDGRLAGNAGCNRYSAPVADAGAAGQITSGPGIATRMACEEPSMAVESRFLRLLPQLQAYRFSQGMLLLAYRREDGSGAELWFRPIATH